LIHDWKTLSLVVGVLVLLGAATAMVSLLRRRADSELDPALIETFRGRVRAWWLLCSVLAAAFLIGQTATVVLFGLIAFWALREFITLTPTRPGDHRTLFWVFFLLTPLQFVLVGIEDRWIFNPKSTSYVAISSYDVYSTLIPVYAFLLIPLLMALSGDYKRFLERFAKIQAGLLICVYCLSHAPALLTLPMPESAPGPVVGGFLTGDAGEDRVRIADSAETSRAGSSPDAGRNVRLLFFFVLMVQLSDAAQYLWSRLPSRHVVVASINPNKTWEGLLGGTATVALLGAALWWATPFPYWLAAGMSAVIALMGFAGSLTMSAIKRDRGVKDYGTLVEGHGGVLDRIDSICFSAPVFFHFTRYYLIVTGVMVPVT